MAKYSGKDEKINGKWYPVTVTASSEKEAIKKLKVGQRKSYGTVSAIRGRFLKEENGSDWTSIKVLFLNQICMVIHITLDKYF